MKLAACQPAAQTMIGTRVSTAFPGAGPKAPLLPSRRAVRERFRETRTRANIRVPEAYALKGKHHAKADARGPGTRPAAKRRAGSFPADLRQPFGGEGPRPAAPGFASGRAIGDTRAWPPSREDNVSDPAYSRRTLAAQALGHVDAATRAVVTPIHVATTFIRDPDNQYRSGYGYGRPDNATVREAEAIVAMLEGAEAALVLGSGMSAATSRLPGAGARRSRRRAQGHVLGLAQLAAERCDELGIESRPGRHRRPGRGSRRGPARRHPPGLARNAGQSAVDDHRSRRGQPRSPTPRERASPWIRPAQRRC